MQSKLTILASLGEFEPETSLKKNWKEERSLEMKEEMPGCLLKPSTKHQKSSTRPSKS
jgi:hypothetical protein